LFDLARKESLKMKKKQEYLNVEELDGLIFTRNLTPLGAKKSK